MTTIEGVLIALWLTLMVAITEACFGFPVSRKLATWVRGRYRAQTVTPPRSWAYRVAERVAVWIGNAIANVFFGRIPGGRK